MMGPLERTGEAEWETIARRLGQGLDLDRLAALLSPLASPVRLRLLRFLTTPHYLEEVASHLKVSRQAARKHLDKLVAIGVLERRSGVRERGPVTEYVVHAKALFLISDEFEKLSTLGGKEPSDVLHRTLEEGDRAWPPRRPPSPGFSIVRGVSTGTHVPLAAAETREWLIGRDPRSDLVVAHDPFASNRHAEVKREGRHLVLSDLRSTNGTWLNWALLPRGASVPISHGDLVGVGKTLLLLWEDGPPRSCVGNAEVAGV